MHDEARHERVAAALQQLGEATSCDSVSDEDLDAAVAAALTVPGVSEELLRRARQLEELGREDEVESA